MDVVGKGRIEIGFRLCHWHAWTTIFWLQFTTEEIENVFIKWIASLVDSCIDLIWSMIVNFWLAHTLSHFNFKKKLCASLDAEAGTRLPFWFFFPCAATLSHFQARFILSVNLLFFVIKSKSRDAVGSRAEVRYQYVVFTRSRVLDSCCLASVQNHTDKVKQGLHAHATQSRARNCGGRHGQRD
jgi:hypothetical protein